MRLYRIVVIVVILLSACGGGNGEATRADVVAKADEACAEHNVKIEQLFADLVAMEPPVGDEALNDFVDEYAGAYEGMAADLTDLEKPSDDAAVEQYLDRVERNAEGLTEAADEDTASGDEFIQAHMNSIREANDLATRVGLKVCSPPEY
jgi:hypothetical protein